MILETIKQKTHESHKALEESPLMHPILRKSITREEYVNILTKFYGFFNPLEKAIQQHSLVHEYLPDFEERRKSSSLLNDLAILNSGTSPEICEDLPSLTNASAAFGCLYVMEGSTLGGRMISKILQEALGVEASSGASFFNGYGADTGTKWKAFQSALVAYSQATGDDEVIVKSAEDTFVKFRNWVMVR